MKKYIALALTLMCLLSFTGCFTPPPTHERSPVAVDWMNFIKIGGISYIKDWEATIVSADIIGEKIGEVTCEVPTIYTDSEGNVYPSELEDGTAYECPIGTELFSVIDRDDAIAALIGKTYYLYTAG